MPKYDYSLLRQQLAMLAREGKVDITALRVFYPKAGWRELMDAVKQLAAIDQTVKFSSKTNMIEVN